MPIVGEVEDNVTPIDVDHRTDREKATKTDAFLDAPIKDRAADCAALADKCEVTVPCQAWSKGCVQTQSRDHDPKTIRADDSHLTLTSCDLFFEVRSNGSAFTKPGGEN